ncbi:GNAT family N-acetyltransferase [Tuberibacillus sp. Marseille-P3662]|uniref:GNAT family N-acetyltransferase n=1 Tax=Tuberibacillus sp. Marseille-P3662 TaxID=1965358 RepID=UPI000A1C96BC|nr:GNAT family N-acetyltransferase [Tuberibacillus sp. Marseille-P3662]
MKITKTKDYSTIAELNQYVHNLHVELYPEHFKAYNYEAAEALFRNAVNKPHHTFLLLEDHHQYLGYAWIEIKDYPENAFKKSYQSVYVHQISIKDVYRKKGYGSQLMQFIEAMAKDDHIDKIELDYWVDNRIAKEFYRKQGFKTYRKFIYKDV